MGDSFIQRHVGPALLLVILSRNVLAFQAPEIRPVTILAHSDSGFLGNITDVRELPDGRVLVNDRTRFKVLLFDATLASSSVLFGADSGSAGRYGRATRLLAYGDSSVFVDVEARSLVLVRPDATLGRAIAFPKTTDILRVSYRDYGTPGFDLQGRIIYMGVPVAPLGAPPLPALDPSKRMTIKRAQIAPLVRGNFDNRTVDTLTWMNLPFIQVQMIGMAVAAGYNPYPMTDDWALLPDGTVAVIRAHDYHIDWIRPDGSISASAKLPFEWRSISLEEKEHVRDSAQRVFDSLGALQPHQGAPRPWPTVIDAADMPDFHPPVRGGEMRADPEGNVWLLPRTTTVVGDGLVYDVVNRNGVVIERVRIPADRSLVGFGRSGALYLRHVLSKDEESLDKARVNR